jgi:hypothetical protein
MQKFLFFLVKSSFSLAIKIFIAKILSKVATRFLYSRTWIDGKSNKIQNRNTQSPIFLSNILPGRCLKQKTKTTKISPKNKEEKFSQ